MKSDFYIVTNAQIIEDHSLCIHSKQKKRSVNYKVDKQIYEGVRVQEKGKKRHGIPG